jgi:hypothetical protein
MESLNSEIPVRVMQSCTHAKHELACSNHDPLHVIGFSIPFVVVLNLNRRLKEFCCRRSCFGNISGNRRSFGRRLFEFGVGEAGWLGGSRRQRSCWCSLTPSCSPLRRHRSPPNRLFPVASHLYFVVCSLKLSSWNEFIRRESIICFG